MNRHSYMLGKPREDVGILIGDKVTLPRGMMRREDEGLVTHMQGDKIRVEWVSGGSNWYFTEHLRKYE